MLAIACGPATAAEPAADQPSVADEPAVPERVSALEAEVDALRRRLASEVRLEADAYLEDRGVGGHTFTDKDLRPLNDVLRRTVLGGGILTSLTGFSNLVGNDTHDVLTVRLRTSVGFALTSGVEIDTELQQINQRGGIFESSPMDPTPYLPASPGEWTMVPTQQLHPNAPVEVLRAEIRLPSFNLLGRLAHVPVTAVVGRQPLSFDDGFVLGEDPSGRGMTWDAVRLFAESGSGTRLDVFAGRMAVGASTAMCHFNALADPASDPTIEVAGIHAHVRGLLPDTSLSCYYFRSQADAIGPTVGSFANVGAADIHTFGVTARADLLPGVDLSTHAAVQSGSAGGFDVQEAWAGEAVLGLRNATGTSSGTVRLAHATGDKDNTPEDEAFRPIAQDPRRWDDFGLLTSKNVTLWGGGYDQSLTRSFSLGLSLARAVAPEPSSDSSMISVPTTGGGSLIGDFLTIRCSWDLYGEDSATLRLSFTHFAPGGYLPSDASEASALTMSVEASF
jgi:hypothetical protein